MAEKIFVTDAQIMAAQMLVERDRSLGREPDTATRKIAEARPMRSADLYPESRSTSHPATVRFWEALEPAERDALRAVASWQTFAPGTRLMTQGERTDHVVVILAGRTKISVEEDGQERVLAIRDQGQLVGERAALQASLRPARAARQQSVRSATVTAIEMVWALVVRGEDFAAFVRARPRVLDILQDQLFDRLTETLTGTGPTAATGGSDDDPAAGRAPHRLEVLNGENCTVLLAGVIGSGADADRSLIREALSSLTAETLPPAPDVWTIDRGGNLLTVLLPSISTADVMKRLAKELPAAVRRHNRSQHASARLQLRLAINVGPVWGGPAGVDGEAITVVSLLLEAKHFSDAIVTSAASLGIVISPFIYETFIRPGEDPSEAASYTQIPVQIQGFSTDAWMKEIPRDPAANQA